ncbi:MAG TPA: phage tail protein, partial [Gaiellaceae bacterium]|nr:phage tail protein [Gaiellaceae bacterium]
KTRARSPILSWAGQATATTALDSGTGTGSPWLYGLDMLLKLGVPFQDGIARITGMWSGERKLGVGAPGFGAGDGGFEVPAPVNSSALPGDAGFEGGFVEVLNGSESMNMVSGSPVAANTYAADHMVRNGTAASAIPGYRGFLCAFLFGQTGGDAIKWYVGAQPQPNAYSFEVTAYPTDTGASSLIGDDVNPATVLFDLLTGNVGKLGLPTSALDLASFSAAFATLNTEGHGMSRCWDGQETAQELIEEILRQVDGVLYEDPTTGLIVLKLIRADYDPNALLVINPSNCKELQNFAASGWTDIPNKVIVKFTDRANNYREGIAIAQSDANAVGQDGEIHEVTLDMPGICTQELADQIASRELQARSRPLMKLRAIVNRSFLRVNPGDVVTLTWPEANISRIVFRVAAVGRGTLESNLIALDLIQDYFYQWRRLHPTPPSHIGLGSVIAFGG